MKSRHLTLALAGLVALGSIAHPTAARSDAVELRVTVDGIRGTAGNVRMTLFAAGDFMNYQRVLRRTISQIREGRAQFRVGNLPPGKYSFTILHDSNANGQADRNFLGIPTEGVAVSNNARGFLGPPDGADAEFMIQGAQIDQTVEMVYF